MPINITSDLQILNDKSINFVDMHHHSTVSDGDKTPAFIAKYFAKAKKGVCITDHNEIKGSVYLAKQKNVFTIPSVEITSNNMKDICGYFYSVNDLISFWEKEIKDKRINNSIFNFHRTSLSVMEIIDKMKDYNSVVILLHSFTTKPKESYELLFDKEIIRKVDGIEAFNFIVGKYEKTLNFVKRFKKPLTAGSDSHYVSSLNVLTGSYESNRNDFLDSILKRKNILYHSKGSLLNRLRENWLVIKNNICLRAEKL